MSNHLGTLHSPAGATQSHKRVGRGQGSGRGGTSARGHKGAKSRSGNSRKRNFEGGQMPYVRRIPKYGFHNPFRVEYQVVNVEQLQALVDAGKLSGETVTPEELFAIGAISKRKAPVKILGNGDLTTKLSVTAHKISASAREKIERAGGTVTIYG